MYVCTKNSLRLIFGLYRVVVKGISSPEVVHLQAKQVLPHGVIDDAVIVAALFHAEDDAHDLCVSVCACDEQIIVGARILAHLFERWLH